MERIQYYSRQRSQNQSASSLILSFGRMHSWWNHSSHRSQKTITFPSSGLRQTGHMNNLTFVLVLLVSLLFLSTGKMPGMTLNVFSFHFVCTHTNKDLSWMLEKHSD